MTSTSGRSSSSDRNGSIRTRITFHEAKAKRATPTEARISARSQYGSDWRVTAETIGLDRLAELDVAIDLAEDEREAEGEAELAEEDDHEPALDADPRGQPASESRGPSCGGAVAAIGHSRSSSRWKTATVPKSCSRSQAASSSAIAIERW